VEAYVRRLKEKVIRLHSLDLQTSVEIKSIRELFNFAMDELGLLKAAVIVSGVVPPWREDSGDQMVDQGFELVTRVHQIRVGSRLAVSTTLLASCIAALMRASGQIEFENLSEANRQQICGRALLGEW
jgi:hypothetical protein